MATSIVKVYNGSRGKWESNARVVLEWTGIANLGQSSPVKTDSNGLAEVSHSSTGSAIVYINGSKAGTMSTPGSSTFTI
jgi:hypothetical protein